MLLRGFARNAAEDRSRSVADALKIYNSMFSENSRVKPSIIHTNAILNTCAKASDTDSMFSIAARLPERGPGAPDNASFTTILNALNGSALQPLKNETEEQKAARRQDAILKGRRIWGDIISRWQENSITIDERLVFAMARLLLVGNTVRDVDDVLSLVEQTMRIPRNFPRIGDPKRKTHLQLRNERFEDPNSTVGSGPLEDVSDPFEPQPETLPRPSSQPTIPTEGASLSPSSEFLSLPPSKNHRIYPAPGCAILSMVMIACGRVHALPEAQKYWDLITRTVKPDQDNYHQYLRLLRARRASGLAVDLVADMTRSAENGGLAASVQPKTFRIAMSACVRNGKSTWALKQGVELLGIMQQRLAVPDVDTMSGFCGLLSKKDMRWPIGDVVNAVDLLFSLFLNLKGVFAFGREAEIDRDDSETGTAMLGKKEEEEDLAEKTAEALDPVSLDWSATRQKARKRGEALSPALLRGGQMDMEERYVLKQLARRLEGEFGRTLQVYGSELAAGEQRKIMQYR
ncbi:MAG: hypothetical protein LQ340_004026, partial [Diploschistes diacapsis]